MSGPTYFLQTVPEVHDTAADTATNLKITVNNTGNYFFEHALAKHLRGHTTVRRISDMAHDDATLVLSMSNFISSYTDLGGMARQIEDRKIARVVMVGAGAQAYDYCDPAPLSAGTRRFIDILSERSHSIGVRGVYTADVLSKLGIKNVEVIGCPSIFLHADPGFSVSSRTGSLEGLRSVFHCTPAGYYRDSVTRLLRFGIENCEAYVAQSETHLFGLHSDNAEDRKNTDFFFKYYNDRSIDPQVAQEWFRGHTKWFFKLEEWLAYMKTMDFAFGARFHGNMAAILMGVPALNMVFDTRTRELCEYLNLPYMHLKDFSADVSLAQLYEQADFGLFNATFAGKYRTYRNFLLNNGLDVSLPAAPAAPGVIGPYHRAAAHRLLEDLLEAGVPHADIARELALRTEPFRSHDERLRAESSKP